MLREKERKERRVRRRKRGVMREGEHQGENQKRAGAL